MCLHTCFFWCVACGALVLNVNKSGSLIFAYPQKKHSQCAIYLPKTNLRSRATVTVWKCNNVGVVRYVEVPNRKITWTIGPTTRSEEPLHLCVYFCGQLAAGTSTCWGSLWLFVCGYVSSLFGFSFVCSMKEGIIELIVICVPVFQRVHLLMHCKISIFRLFVQIPDHR